VRLTETLISSFSSLVFGFENEDDHFAAFSSSSECEGRAR
jgi:hypothetical protein